MIYIVRHGQTDWNVCHRYQGRQDIELNEKGIVQAKEIAEKLKTVEFYKVFSSPLKRAYQTAKEIYKGKIIEDERLLERCNGELEGKTKEEILDHIDFNDINGSGHGIEHILKFRNRIYEFLDEVTKKYVNENILIVTHAGVCTYIRCYFEGEPKNLDYASYKLKNGEILKYNNNK